MENGISRSTTQACAACKYQRRKCGSSCILAPYFPHDRQKQFLNAHRLFGVGKISNMLKPLDQTQRDIAMHTIMYQAEMRAKDPVGGCLNVVLQLQSQIDIAKAELQLVLQHLAFFKAQANNNPSYIASETPPVFNLEDTSSHEQQRQHKQQFEQQLVTYNSSQEDFNMWDIHNSVPLSPFFSPIQEEDINQDPVVHYTYDQKPVLELMEKINSESNGSKELNPPP